MKKYWTYILIFLLLGCKTKKQVLRTEIRTSDTLIVKSEMIKAPVLNQALTIEQICDTVTGEVVRFKKVFVVDGDSIEILTNDNNQLQVKISQLEKLVKQKDSIASVKESENTMVSENTIYKKDWRWIFSALAIGFSIGIIKPWRFFI
ncbi:hypothetical protein [Flagellimonas nanhaiensis]|uniref:Lipoprotein n=1 Tax=Flagellimonas nanhaiensis TaxID=2292706 RepID=A0A371JL90_9FLAO|nr:hypothetical protein [Allomuricauda nanhaiensis]RDY57732.1 hypothetical protein DX873_17695 [Allomuricauda nanhaiensis]